MMLIEIATTCICFEILKGEFLIVNFWLIKETKKIRVCVGFDRTREKGWV